MADHRVCPEHQRGAGRRGRRPPSPRRSARVPGVRLLDVQSDADAPSVRAHLRRRPRAAARARCSRCSRPTLARDRPAPPSRRAPAARRRRRRAVRADRGRDDGRLRRAGARGRRRGGRRASACRSSSTKRPPPRRRAATSRTSAAASSRASPPRSRSPEWAPDFGPAAPHRHGRRRRSSARACRSSPTTSTWRPIGSTSPRRSPPPSARAPAASAS